MSILNDEISNKIGRRLFYGKTTVRTFAKEERDNIETEIEVNTRGLAVFSHLESTIEWIMKLLEIDIENQRQSIWKFMVDGRPKCSESEVLVE